MIPTLRILSMQDSASTPRTDRGRNHDNGAGKLPLTLAVRFEEVVSATIFATPV